jgi:hypothetical protein
VKTSSKQWTWREERPDPMSRRLKIVVAGYAVGFPMGGQVWMMLHYMLGLQRLGHDVLFLEDTSDWSYPFDPEKGYGSLDSSFGRGVLEDLFGRYGLKGRWAYNSALEGKLYGPTQAEFDRFCREADLFLNISGVNPLRESYMQCKVKAVIDTDPVFTQMKISQDPDVHSYFKSHDAFFTYGYNIPTRKIGVPLSGIDWKPFLPPVLLQEWKPRSSPGQGYTTVGSWDVKGRDIVLNGEHLSWRKSIKYEALIDMPRLLPGVELELTFSGMDRDGPRYKEHGWNVRDALMVSRDPWLYRDYIQESRAEFTVAKDQNVKLKSGWFSDRSASYLASGRPVITEDTGFGDYLPVGEGLFAFQTMEDAMDAIRKIEADPSKHRKAAERIAAEYFDAEKLLRGLLREVGLD